jgi:hypothetical protein
MIKKKIKVTVIVAYYLQVLLTRSERNQKHNKRITLPLSILFIEKVVKNSYSSVNGRFRVETTEVRRVHVHSSLLIVTSNQNASNKTKNRLNIYPKPGMSHYTLSDS